MFGCMNSRNEEDEEEEVEEEEEEGVAVTPCRVDLARAGVDIDLGGRHELQ